MDKDKLKQIIRQLESIANRIDEVAILLDQSLLSGAEANMLYNIGTSQAEAGMFYLDAIKKHFEEQKQELINNKN